MPKHPPAEKPTVTTDDQWKFKIATLTDPIELLREIVSAVDDGLYGHDPYYTDFKQALQQQARVVIRLNESCTKNQ